MPLDKIYPQNENMYQEDDIEIKSNIPDTEEVNEDSENKSEDFGLYKKYL